ncbi:MAG: hypothetical protein HKO93_04190, partial [Flavobacteriales bacterium]|nr:hypothetical protein [Flavobacteriales bacterium]
AEAYARGKVEEFERSPMFRAAMLMDKIYNYLFIIIGLSIVVLPFYGVSQLNAEERAEYNYVMLVIPVVVGIIFVYGLWYFVFKLDESD